MNCKDSHVNQVVYGQCPTAFNGHCLAWEAETLISVTREIPKTADTSPGQRGMDL